MPWATLSLLRRSLVFLLASFIVALPAHAMQRHTRSPKAPGKQIMRASWYGRSFQGRRTAGGTIFNPKKLTAAHRTLDIGSKVKVTELRTGRSVVVQITDRGPYHPNRGIDLSYAAAQQLGIVHRGVAQVQVEPLAGEQAGLFPPVVTASSLPRAPWFLKAITE